MLIFRVFGAFFFGAADKLETALKRAQQEPKILILRMRKVLAMDATGLNALEDLYEKMHKRGQQLILSGPHTQPYITMEKAGFLEQLGRKTSARILMRPSIALVKYSAFLPLRPAIRCTWKRRISKPRVQRSPRRRSAQTSCSNRACRVATATATCDGNTRMRTHKTYSLSDLEDALRACNDAVIQADARSA